VTRHWSLPHTLLYLAHSHLSSIEHNRDADQPADHMVLNCGKPKGTGQKFDPIHSIRTWGIQIKGIWICLSAVDIHDLFGEQYAMLLFPYRSTFNRSPKKVTNFHFIICTLLYIDRIGISRWFYLNKPLLNLSRIDWDMRLFVSALHIRQYISFLLYT
jgi:hypothetical protein